MDILIKVAQLLLSLSILVLIHEFGHFIAAKMFKTRVEKFYLFFDFLFPLPNVANFALFKKKIGDTEYGIGWFPLGGYVKIAGMVDESMDEEQMKLPPKPDEFRSKKNWQKLIIMLGGIIMNLLLGWLIYSQLMFWKGEEYLPTAKAKYGIACDSLGTYAGFKDGDVIISHDGGKKFDNMSVVAKDILLDDISTVEVLRNGQPYTITLPNRGDLQKKMVESKGKGFIDIRLLPIVGDFAKENVVEGKLKKDDVILSINDSAIHYFHEMRGVLSKYKKQEVKIVFLRGKDTMNTKVQLTDSLLGIAPVDPDTYMDFTKISYPFFQSFGKGAQVAVAKLGDYFKQFGLIFNRKVKGYKQLGGVGTIGSLFPSEWDWGVFWALTAFISLMLAVMNLLPIPMLDGGYVIMLLFEMITGITLSDRTLENINRVGFVIIIALMLYANGMDLFRALFNH